MIVESVKLCIEIVLALSLTLLCDIELLFTFQYFDYDRHIYDFTQAGVTQRSCRLNVMLVKYIVLSISKQDGSYIAQLCLPYS